MIGLKGSPKRVWIKILLTCSFNPVFSKSYFKKQKVKLLAWELMRLNQPPAKIWSKSYLNRLLINFCNSIPAVRSIVATISIQIRIQILILNLILYQKKVDFIKNWSNLIKNRDKIDNFWSNLTNFDYIFDIWSI